MAKIGAIHYNWAGYDLEGFARRASEIGYQYCELQIGDIWDGESNNGEQTAEATRERQAAESGRTAFLLVLREGAQQFLQVTKD